MVDVLLVGEAVSENKSAFRISVEHLDSESLVTREDIRVTVASVRDCVLHESESRHQVHLEEEEEEEESMSR